MHELTIKARKISPYWNWQVLETIPYQPEIEPSTDDLERIVFGLIEKYGPEAEITIRSNL